MRRSPHPLLQTDRNRSLIFAVLTYTIVASVRTLSAHCLEEYKAVNITFSSCSNNYCCQLCAPPLNIRSARKAQA